jgi:uncharacterized protein
MNKDWKAPKTIIGSVATGEYYFPREEIIDNIWFELEKGSSILLAAPRRVGKTSIMRALEKNPKDGFLVKFEIIQAVKSEDEFYEVLYKLVLSCLNRTKKIQQWFKKYIAEKSLTEIDFNGTIKFGDRKFDYINEINSIFRKLDDSLETVILLLDELPEVLHNMNKEGKTEEAKSILKQLRAWRQSDFKKLQFVLAGSIGIHYVVKSIEGRTSDLNDLNKIICEPLGKSQAIDYINWVTKDATLLYNEDQKNNLLEKIQHYYTPYFLNLMIDEIDTVARKLNNIEISNQLIDQAFNAIVSKNEHFADWKSRLSEYMPNDEFKFVNEILKHIAHKDLISIQTIYNVAVAQNKTDDYMELINDLEQDGYIVKDDKENYVFISPLLKAFWLRNNPIYNG